MTGSDSGKSRRPVGAGMPGAVKAARPRRRLRWWALGVLLALALLAAGSTAAIHKLQGRRAVAGLLVKADEAHAAGNLADELGYLMNYAEAKPRDFEARGRLGLLIARNGGVPADFAIALKHLELARRGGVTGPEARGEAAAARVHVAAGPEDRKRALADFEEAVENLSPDEASKLRERTARLAQRMGRHDAAGVIAQKLLETGRDDRAKASAQALLGEVAESAGKPADAISGYEAALKLDPTRVDAAARLAALLWRDPTRRAGALPVLDRLVAAAPGSARARLERARLRRVAEAKGVEEDLAEALKLAPDDRDTLLMSAAEADAAGRRDEARDILDRAVTAHPKDTTVRLASARLAHAQEGAEAGVSALRRGVEATEGAAAAELRWWLASWLIDLGRREEAAAERKELDRLKFDEPLRRLLEARDRLAAGRPDEAAALLREVEPRLGPGPARGQALALLATCYALIGDAARAELGWSRALALDPDDNAARLGLAEALAEQGRPAAAIEEYRKIRGNLLAVRLRIAQLALRAVLAEPPPRRRWQALDAELALLQEVAADRPEVPVLRADALMARDRGPEALKILAEARGKLPTEPILWAAEAMLMDKLGQAEQALARLDEAEAQAPPLSSPLLGLARLRVLAGRPRAAALAGLRAWEAAHPVVPPGEAPPGGDTQAAPAGATSAVPLLLATAYRGLGARDDAARVLDRMNQAWPGGMAGLLVRFDLAFEAGDEAAMAATAEALERIEGPAGRQWRCARAALKIKAQSARAARGEATEAAELAAARGLIAELSAEAPEWPRPYLLRAELAALEGLEEVALDELLGAIRRGDRQPAVLRRAVNLLSARGRYAEAEDLFREAAEADLMTLDLRRAAAEVSALRGNAERALQLAERAIDARSADWRDQLWLGQLAAAMGRVVPALDHLKRACALAPDRAEAWLALASAAHRLGRPREVETALLAADKALTADRAGWVRASQALASGDATRAADLFLARHKADLADAVRLKEAAQALALAGRLAEAGPLLEELVRRGESPAERAKLKGAAAEAVAWARRALALRQLQGIDAFRGERALATLAPNLAGHPTANDRKVEGLALAVQPERRAEAIARLEDVRRRAPMAPEELRILAGLHDVEGNWPKARAILVALATAKVPDADATADLIAGMLRHGQAVEARAWVERLGKLRPDDTATARLRIKQLAASGRRDEAVAQAGQAAARPEADFARLGGRMLEEVGQPARAEPTFRKLAAADRDGASGDRLALIGFLARRGAWSEALDRLVAELAAEAPAARLGPWVETFFLGPPAPPAARSASGLLKLGARLDALAAGEGEAAANWGITRALFDIWIGESPSAELRYRAALAKVPTHAVVLNNLAWLVAVRGGDPAEALDLVERAIAEAGAYPELLDTRAVVRLQGRRPGQAVEDLRRAARARPDLGPIQIHLAVALQLNGQGAEARAAWAEARRRDWSAAMLPALEQQAFAAPLAQLDAPPAGAPAPKTASNPGAAGQ